ncbi:coniferyl aldehyde dehydrogenase [Marinomonas sp. C2222]|uniref:Aldehyde dehydrogenase n=1 Tax=Marinomonas sargassi TaxID=2984494 RepID=A0ABT2YQ55_9GAMM|nr:coniferyl aldehyde dehydrogenase [Marinomonas sargassi]MCV2401986.1 coniferyl aldehyde dehydrogenase [Marinomonas sargassi]
MTTLSPIEHFPTIFSNLKKLAQGTPYPSLTVRLQALTCLQEALLRHETPLLNALQKDFGNRAHEESRILELIPLLGEIKHAKKNLKKWMKPTKRNIHISAFPATAKVVYQPKGVIGVISPWNYPVLLSLGPLVGSLAAGNRTMIKVSELCPETNKVLKNILNAALGEKWVTLIEGEVEAANAFSSLPFDHLLFTGSTSVGKLVMKNATSNLTPVTLELGGKSPLIVAPSANLKDTAEKIIFGKMLNAGQTCVAPDYVFCHQDQKQELIKHIRHELAICYPNGTQDTNYTSMINAQQMDRLQGYLTEAKAAGVTCENLMEQDAIGETQNKLGLHIVDSPMDELSVMQDEIFGPLLPILTYTDIEQAFTYMKGKPRPLAMYLFSQNQEEQKYCEEQMISGSLVINHTLIQVAQPDLPFGGIGTSGMGQYHAAEGFRTFSHGKSVLNKSHLFNTIRMLRPPYDRPVHKWLKKYWPFL